MSHAAAFGVLFNSDPFTRGERVRASRLRVFIRQSAIGYFPMPDIATCCGLPAALSVRLSAALRVAVAVGLKVTLMVQLAPAAREVPQMWV
jgi:hypothetical protein